MGKLIPPALALVGLLVGGGAGYMLRPDPVAEAAGDGPAAAEDHAAPDGHAATGESGHAASPDGPTDYVKLNNQFVVPVVHDGKVAALVVLSLSLEVPAGDSEFVYAREPRLRDALLQVMFDHANAGGFDGAFTESGTMTLLRRALLEAAEQVLDRQVRDVLLTDIVRQDA